MKIPTGPSFGNEKFGKLPGNFAQAFDLSTLAKPAASQNAQSSSSGANSSVEAREVLDSNIVEDFIKYSATAPVILIIHSERAKGSLELLQIFAELAKADGGKWRLGGVNFDKQPELVQALGATTIPFAIAFINEKALPLPELPNSADQLRLLVNKILEIAREQGMAMVDNHESTDSIDGGEVAEPEEDEALQAIEEEDYERAIAAYQKLLARAPHHQFAALGKAQCELQLRIKGSDPKKVIEEADSNPANLAKTLLAADIELASGLVDQAFDRLIAAIKITRGDDRKDENKKVREHLLSLFSLFAPDDSIVIQARKRLASALF